MPWFQRKVIASALGRDQRVKKVYWVEKVEKKKPNIKVHPGCFTNARDAVKEKKEQRDDEAGASVEDTKHCFVIKSASAAEYYAFAGA
jgi:hypothetical protein